MKRSLGLLAVAVASSVVCYRTARAQEERAPRVYDLLPLLHTNSIVSDPVAARGSLLVEQRKANEPADSRFEVRIPALEMAERGSWTIEMDHLTDVLAGRLEDLFDRDANEFELATTGGRLRGHLTTAEHRAALYLLEHVRSATDTLVEVECVLAPRDAWSELTTTTSFEGEGRNVIFERALLDPRSRLLSVVGRNGQWTSSGPLTRYRVHDDFAVNQTGVIPVVDPVVNDRWAGEKLEVVPLVLGRRGQVFLDLAIGQYAVRSRKMSLEGPWGELDSPVQEERLLSTSLVMRPGEAVLAGELNAPAGLIALVRVNSPPATSGGQAPRVGERVLRVHETAPLFRIHRRSLDDPGDRDRWDDEDLVNRLESHFRGDDQGVFALQRLGDDLAVVATEEVHQWITSMIDEELAKLARNVRIDLEVLTVPRALYAELSRRRDGAMLLADDWTTALQGKADVQRERYSVRGAAGQVHGLRDVEWEPFLVGVDQISGGTGFAIIEVADPVFADGGSGTQLRVEATLAAEGNHAHVRFEGERARIVEKRSVSTVYPVLAAITEQKSQSAPAVVGQKVQLTLPQQESIRWDIAYTVPLGRWSILYRDAKAGEGVQLVVARVTAGEE